MATDFPAGIDSFAPNPSPTSPRNNPSLAGKVVDLSDAVVAIETSVGTTGSADTNSLQYRVDALESSPAPLVFAPVQVGLAPTARSFACKGNIFTPAADMNVTGLRIIVDAAAPYTIRGHIITNVANAIATISTTAEYTYDSAGFGTFIDLLFASPVALTGGTAYGLMAGLSSAAGGATATTNFPLQTFPRVPWQSLYMRGGTLSSSVYHVASLTPTVATGVTTATNDQASGARTYVVGPIFTWA